MKINNALPSNKNFGIFLSSLFFLGALYSFFILQSNLFWYLITISFLFAAISYSYPRVFYPVNWLWYYFGIILGKLFSPIIISLLFYIIVSPIAIVVRTTGRDELKIKKNKKNTYWVKRSKSLTKESFSNQY